MSTAKDKKAGEADSSAGATAVAAAETQIAAEQLGGEEIVAPERAHVIPRARLIAESRSFLQCDPHVAAGALHAHKGDGFTVEKAKGFVTEWLEKPEKGAA